jgi:hypothetical protein
MGREVDSKSMLNQSMRSPPVKARVVDALTQGGRQQGQPCHGSEATAVDGDRRNTPQTRAHTPSWDGQPLHHALKTSCTHGLHAPMADRAYTGWVPCP